MRRSVVLCILCLYLSGPAATAAAEPAGAGAESADIFAAIRAGDVGAVERLLDARPELIGIRDASGATPLVAAAFRRQGVHFVRLEDNAVFAALAARDKAPDLVEACLLGRRDVVAKAIKKDRTQARAASANGRTLLNYAAYVGDVAMIDLLLDAGADIEAPAAGVFNSRPILQAILGDRQAALERLIARGADVSTHLDDGLTAMHEAGLLGRDQMVRTLYRAGAAPAPARRDGKTPRDLAIAEGHMGTARLLEELTAPGAGG